MADEPTEGQVPTVQEPPVVGHAPIIEAVPQTTEAPEEEPFDKERAMSLIRKQREELKAAVKVMKELDQLRADKKSAEDSQKTEQERQTQRAADAEAKLANAEKLHRDQVNRYEVQLQAGKIGIIDPEAAVKLLDWDGLELDSDGRPKDVDEALKELVKARPWLGTQPASQQQALTARTAGATRNTNAPGSRVYTAAELQDYTFYTKNRDDIIAAHKEGRIEA